jgi:DNA recombination protein RmuC
MLEALFFALGLLLGAGLIYTLNAKSSKNIETLLNNERLRNSELNERLMTLTAQNATLTSEAQHAKQYAEKMKDEFKLLAAEAMAKSEEQNKNSVELTLKPLKEQLESFRKKVDDTYNAESAERKHLSIAVTELKEQNKKLGDEANALVNALKNRSKTQGMWGEMVLENILSSSGLRAGEEYTLQGGYTGEEGERIIPDAIVNMPEGKKIIIDSKVTLVSYLDYCESDTEETRAAAAKALLTSVKKHIDTLSAKRYQDIDNAFEYVFMFIPLEGAYMTAIAEDKALFEYALKKNIALVTASSLMTTLKTVYMIWRSERQNANAALIAKEAGAVYDKMHGFLQEFDKIAVNLERAQKSYTEARKLLSTGRGAALVRLEKLKDMGAKTAKSIEEHIDFQGNCADACFVDVEAVEGEN